MCLSSFFSAISHSVVIFRFAFRRLDFSISLKWRNGVGERWNRGMGGRKVQRISNANKSVHGFCRGLRNFGLTVKRFGFFSFCCTLPSSLFLYTFFSSSITLSAKNQCVRLRFILQLPLSCASACVYSFLSCPAHSLFSSLPFVFSTPVPFMLWRTRDDWNYENCIIFVAYEIEASDSFYLEFYVLYSRFSMKCNEFSFDQPRTSERVRWFKAIR